jgi:hypothetical protein
MGNLLKAVAIVAVLCISMALAAGHGAGGARYGADAGAARGESSIVCAGAWWSRAARRVS